LRDRQISNHETKNITGGRN